MLDSKSIWHTIVWNNILTDDRGLMLYTAHDIIHVCVDSSLKARTVLDMVCYQATILYIMLYTCSSSPLPPNTRNTHYHKIETRLSSVFFFFLFSSKYNLLDVIFLRHCYCLPFVGSELVSGLFACLYIGLCEDRQPVWEFPYFQFVEIAWFCFSFWKIWFCICLFENHQPTKWIKWIRIN